jgi:DNA polymerase
LRLNKGMTASEKTSIAHFLDLAADMVRDGYRSGEREYLFADDPAVPEAASVSAPLPAPLSRPQEMSAAEPAVPYGTENCADSLEKIDSEVHTCTSCALCGGRTCAVPGEGAARPLVMVIGEGPGAEEDASGRPFVGPAGQLLDKMLASIGLSREQNCFLANVVKCRPPNNRDPLPEETAACALFLERQIRLLRPRFILCAGRVAAQTLLKTGESVGKLRGRFAEFSLSGGSSVSGGSSAGSEISIPLLATYHPSALLRNEELKRPAWEDLKILRTKLPNNLIGES